MVIKTIKLLKIDFSWGGFQKKIIAPQSPQTALVTKQSTKQAQILEKGSDMGCGSSSGNPRNSRAPSG
jgi:hypothetical protein